MYCSQCGHQLPRDGRFCSACGAAKTETERLFQLPPTTQPPHQTPRLAVQPMYAAPQPHSPPPQPVYYVPAPAAVNTVTVQPHITVSNTVRNTNVNWSGFDLFFLVRIAWLCTFGWILGLGWAILALCICCTIIGIPLGLSMLRLAPRLMFL